jgi:hypothetical protein
MRFMILVKATKGTETVAAPGAGARPWTTYFYFDFRVSSQFK